MITLSLSSVENCILEAYRKFLADAEGDFNVDIEDGQVKITCRINEERFNCGFPGYNMRF